MSYKKIIKNDSSRQSHFYTNKKESEKENKKEQSTDATKYFFLKITEIILRLLYTVHLSDCSFCISDVRGFPHSAILPEAFLNFCLG